MDKYAALLAGRSLLDRVCERARPQADALLLNSNNEIFAHTSDHFGRLPDDAPGEGPLAGILAALNEAERRDFTHVASFACDTPFFPLDTVAQLSGTLRKCDGDLAVARCGGKAHRIFALWPVTHRARLQEAFAGGVRSMRGVEDWLTPVWADFPPEGAPGGDPFFNINTPADLATAEEWLSRASSDRQLRI